MDDFREALLLRLDMLNDIRTGDAGLATTDVIRLMGEYRDEVLSLLGGERNAQGLWIFDDGDGE